MYQELLVCFLLREAGQDCQEKQKRPYLLNEAFLGKFMRQTPRKHHKDAYDTLFFHLEMNDVAASVVIEQTDWHTDAAAHVSRVN